MKPRRKNLMPRPQPQNHYDGWTQPTTTDVEPADYPWENSKI